MSRKKPGTPIVVECVGLQERFPNQMDKTGITIKNAAFYDSGGREQGKPRRISDGRRAGECSPQEQGTPTDPETGKPLVPEGLRDTSIDPKLVGLSVDETLDALDEEKGDPNEVTDATLQREVKVMLSSHSSGSKIKKPKPRVQSSYNEHLAIISEPRGLDDEQRAQRLHDRYVLDLESGKRGVGGPGRPLADGQSEPKMHLNVRLEPTTVIELSGMTQKKPSELLVEFYRLLKMARNGEEAESILRALSSILTSEP